MRLTTRGIFWVLEKCKKIWLCFMTLQQKSFFYWKNFTKNSYQLHWQSVEQTWLDHQQVWYWDAWHVWSYSEWFNIFEWILVLTREPRYQWRAKNVLFCIFSDPLGHQSILVSTKTDIEIKHYHTCINTQFKFCHDLFYSLRGSDLSWRGTSLAICRIIKIKMKSKRKRENTKNDLLSFNNLTLRR